MPRTEVKNEVFEDLQNHQIIFRNFAGTTDAYNQSGKRQFSIILDQDRAADLNEKGWNVKVLHARDEGEPDTPFLPVEANLDGYYPPKVYLMSGVAQPDGTIDIQAKTMLDEDTIAELDHANFAKVDIIVSPYSWEWNGRTGIKAYAKAIYATVILDPLEMKYANIGNNNSLAPNPYEDDEVPFN